MDDLTKGEKSLLLFFETAYVDFGGKLNPQHMNDDDRVIAKKWNETGYIEFGRVQLSDIIDNKSYYVFLSDEAFTDAHEERKARAKRMFDRRTWKTVKEKRGAD